MVTFIDLFCGIGSFHYSFKKLGFECVMACDINKYAKETYKLNYDMEPKGDIVDINPDDVPAFNILSGGFPCQTFSNIGKQKGFDDERGTLFFQIMKFVTTHNPDVIVLENVSALLTHDNGATYLRMKTTLENEGYSIVEKILKCSDYGIPQMRKRLFIVAIKTTIILEKNIEISKFLDFPTIHTPTLSTYLGKPFEKDVAFTIRCGGRKSRIDDKHNWDGYIVDGREYRLSVADCLKLQGFDNFELSGSETQQYKLLGNSIPTNFTYLIGKKIKETLYSN